MFNIGTLYRTGGKGLVSDPQKAEEYFKRASSESPFDALKAHIDYERAGLAAQNNKISDALALYLKAEQQSAVPSISSQAAFALGGIYKNEGNLPLAVNYYKKAAAGTSQVLPQKSWPLYILMAVQALKKI